MRTTSHSRKHGRPRATIEFLESRLLMTTVEYQLSSTGNDGNAPSLATFTVSEHPYDHMTGNWSVTINNLVQHTHLDAWFTVAVMRPSPSTDTANDTFQLQMDGQIIDNATVTFPQGSAGTFQGGTMQTGGFPNDAPAPHINDTVTFTVAPTHMESGDYYLVSPAQVTAHQVVTLSVLQDADQMHTFDTNGNDLGQTDGIIQFTRDGAPNHDLPVYYDLGRNIRGGTGTPAVGPGPNPGLDPTWPTQGFPLGGIFYDGTGVIAPEVNDPPYTNPYLSHKVIIPAGQTSVLLHLKNLDDGEDLDTQQWEVTLENDPRIRPGDANRDGYIDNTDYTITAQHYGQAGNWSQGDFNGDGVVDFNDLVTVARNEAPGIRQPEYYDAPVAAPPAVLGAPGDVVGLATSTIAAVVKQRRLRMLDHTGNEMTVAQIESYYLPPGTGLDSPDATTRQNTLKSLEEALWNQPTPEEYQNLLQATTDAENNPNISPGVVPLLSTAKVTVWPWAPYWTPGTASPNQLDMNPYDFNFNALNPTNPPTTYTLTSYVYSDNANPTVPCVTPHRQKPQAPLLNNQYNAAKKETVHDQPTALRPCTCELDFQVDVYSGAVNDGLVPAEDFEIVMFKIIRTA